MNVKTTIDQTLAQFQPQIITQAINELTSTNYNVITKLGVFRNINSPVDTITIDSAQIQNNVIPYSTDPASPPTVASSDTRKLHKFSTIKLEYNDSFQSQDIRNLLAHGTELQQSVSNFLVQRLDNLKRRHENTHEFMKAQAIKGKIIDPYTNTLFFDFYQEFGKTQIEKSVKTTASAKDMLPRFSEIVGLIQEALNGNLNGNPVMLVGEKVWNMLLINDEIRSTFNSYQQMNDLNRIGVPNGFMFGGVLVIRYPRLVMKNTLGADIVAIGDDEGYVFPNMQDYFSFYTATNYYNFSTPNEVYTAWWQENYNKKGYDLYSMSNVLAVSLKPASVIKVHIM